jgi:hypothetical protein
MSQRNAAKMSNNLPQLQTLQLKMTEARQTGNQLEGKLFLSLISVSFGMSWAICIQNTQQTLLRRGIVQRGFDCMPCTKHSV